MSTICCIFVDCKFGLFINRVEYTRETPLGGILEAPLVWGHVSFGGGLTNSPVPLKDPLRLPKEPLKHHSSGGTPKTVLNVNSEELRVRGTKVEWQDQMLGFQTSQVDSPPPEVRSQIAMVPTVPNNIVPVFVSILDWEQ